MTVGFFFFFFFLASLLQKCAMRGHAIDELGRENRSLHENNEHLMTCFECLCIYFRHATWI